MKKNKILTSILSGAAIIATPLVTVTTIASCGNSYVGNLMKESQPTITPLEASAFSDCVDPIQVNDKYINKTRAINDAFRQDLVYTMSRGVTSYNKYLTDNGIIIKSNSFDIRVNDITPTSENRTISFVASMLVNYDYSGSSQEALNKCGIKNPKLNKTIKFKMVLDLDTSTGFESAGAKYRQLTAKAKDAIEIGISEINSTIEFVEENKEATQYHFITPQQDYWDSISEPDQYQKRVEEINALKDTELYVPVALLTHYLGTNTYSLVKTPNTIELGSFYFQNMELLEGFEFYSDASQNYICNGYNISNRLETNIRKLSASEWLDDVFFTLPKYDSKNNTISILAKDSFMQGSNRGLPDDIERITICNNYKSIQANSISCNTNENMVNELIFAIDNDKYGTTLPAISANAFGTMLNLKTINFSQYPANGYVSINAWKKAFNKIHEGWSETELDEGTIIIPSCSAEVEIQWKNALNEAGLNIKGVSQTQTSWNVEQAA